MGGLDWQALPVVAEMFGVDDIESFLARLVAIRDWHRAQSETD